jgi:hypothetical protein
MNSENTFNSSGNTFDTSGNTFDTSGNPYRDASGNVYKRCNAMVNNEEYYAGGEIALNALGGIFSIPFILSSLLCSACFMSVFIAISVSIYNTSEQKMTGGMIFTIICCLLCLSLFISNIISYIRAKRNMDLLKTNPDARPCYSDKQQKIIN